jgi:diguanylate cyclase (GGDEF)-like protein
LPDVVYHLALPDAARGDGVTSPGAGRLEYINASVGALTGYSPAEHYASPQLIAALLDPAGRGEIADGGDGPLGAALGPRLIHWIRPDGSAVWGEHRAVRIRDASGEVVAVQGLLTDVTERVLAERVAEAQARVLESVAQGRPLSESRDAALTAIETELPRTVAVLMESVGVAVRVVSAPTEPGLVGQRGDCALHRALSAQPERARPAVVAVDALPGLPEALRSALAARGADRAWIYPVASAGDEPREYLLVLASRDPHGDREARLPAAFARLLSIADERDRAERALRHQARHDHLTGLANRSEVQARLESALREAPRTGRVVAVLFCDLDRFKTVNDSLGHSAGDALLVAVAERLRAAASGADVVARTGGDEFTVIHATSTDAMGAVAAAGRLVDAMDAPFRVLGRRVYASMSVGVAVGTGHGSTAEALIRDADAAMYRAKELGGRRVELFDTIMQVRARERLELETGLHGALARREFSVAYQPQVDLRSGRVIGAEALLRWSYRGRPVPPAEFIPVAEDTGLIVPIGAWVLRTACAVAARQSRLMPGFRMGVNLSARQLADPRLTEQVARALTTTALPPRQLCLEVTETTLMDDAPAALATLRTVHELGVTFAIDDFGTGYSSLLYLKRLPVSALKIDTAFVRGLGRDADDEAIVASTIQLGHALGRRVIGEGVETQGQQAHLEALGCRYAQGFRFGHPGPLS